MSCGSAEGVSRDFCGQGSGRDPYGAALMASGECAYDNPFGFSTKYEDGETALVYYGYPHWPSGPSGGRTQLCNALFRFFGADECSIVFAVGDQW